MPHFFEVTPMPNALCNMSLVLLDCKKHAILSRELPELLSLQAEEVAPGGISHFSLRRRGGGQNLLSADDALEELASSLARLSIPAALEFRSLRFRLVEISVVYDDVHTISAVELSERSVQTLANLSLAVSFSAVNARNLASDRGVP